MQNQTTEIHHNPTMIESSSKPLICWRSVFGGFLITMFVMAGLLGLGMAFGGIGLDDDTTAKGAGMFSGIWFIASSMVSIFVGSYYSARVSSFRLGKVGSAQGLLIAVMFVGFFLYQTFSVIGSAGQAVGYITGKTATMVGAGAKKGAENDQVSSTVMNMVEDRLGDLNLKSEPSVVATGVANRLMNGNAEGAKNYLANQAGISQAEADARIAQFKAEAEKAIDQAKMAAATALKSAGWSLFLMVALSAIASILGGMLGSRANTHSPIVRKTTVLRTQHV